MSIGLALGVPSGSMAADPPKRGAYFQEDAKAVGAASNFSYRTWRRQYGAFWTKYRGVKPKTKKDIYYFNFTADGERKVELLRKKFPLKVGRFQAVEVEFSDVALWKAAREVGKFLYRKHPDLSDGTMSMEWKHTYFVYPIVRRAPKVKRYVERRWRGAIRIKQPARR